MIKIYELNDKLAVKYAAGLFYMAKLFKQSHRSHFAILNNRSYTLRKPTVYPDQKFLSDLDMVIPYETQSMKPLTPVPEINGYIEAFGSTGYLFNPNGLTYIIWDIEKFYSMYKTLESMKRSKKIPKVVFLQSEAYLRGGSLLPTIDCVQIYDDLGNLAIQSEPTSLRLTSGIPRIPNPRHFNSLCPKTIYRNKYTFVGEVTTHCRIDDYAYNSSIPIDIIFRDLKYYIDKESEFIDPYHVDVIVRNEFTNEIMNQINGKRCFLSKSMIPKEFTIHIEIDKTYWWKIYIEFRFQVHIY